MKKGLIIYRKELCGYVNVFQKATKEFVHQSLAKHEEHTEDDYKDALEISASIQQTGKLYFLENQF